MCPLDLAAGRIGAGIADIPNAAEMGFNNALVMNGVYVLCNTSVASRALYGRPEITTRLRVNDPEVWDALSGIVNRFNQSHDDVRVLLTTDSEAQDHIVENMMRQDNSIDIYILETSKPSYEAVFNRGFLMPLNDSAAITALAGQMYPGIQRAITRQGKLQVLPMQAGAYILGVNEKTLKKLGLTRADIPDNWDAFLDFLPTLEGPLSDNPDVKLMDGASSINQLRLILLGLIFNGYDYYNTANDIDAPFNAEPMRSLTEKLAAVDFEPLGLEWDEEATVDELMTYSYALEPTCLFNFTTGCTPYSFGWLDYQPLLLDLTADRLTCLLIDCQMAAVNPYTRYPKQALEFMEALAESLSPGLRATLMPDWTEPVRGDSNAHMIEEQREIVAQLEDQLAAASDANRKLAQSDLDYARETLEGLEQNAWDVSPRALEWYHAHDQYVMPTGVNWLESDLGKGNQENLLQFCAGKLSGEDLLSGFDKSTDMMRREGN